MRKYIALVVALVATLSLLPPPASMAGVGFGGGTSFTPGAIFPFPAGVESTIQTSFYVQNFGDVDLELELTYGSEPGIVITPAVDQDTFLPTGSSTDFFFDITVEPSVPPGTYPIILNLRQANFEVPEGGGSVYVPALAGQFTVDVIGDGASVTVKAVSAFDRAPAVGNLALFYVYDDDRATSILSVTDSQFTKTLVPGNYRVTFDIPNLQRRELEFEVTAGENKDVLFEIPTIDFVSVGAIPSRGDRNVIQLVTLSMNVYNNLRALDGPVEFFTRIYRNGDLVEEYPISTLPALPTGEVLQRATYLSEGGFAPGDWEFKFFVRTSEFEVEGPRSVTISSPNLVRTFFIEALLILGALVIIGLLLPRKWWIALLRRRKKKEEDVEAIQDTTTGKTNGFGVRLKKIFRRH